MMGTSGTRTSDGFIQPDGAPTREDYQKAIHDAQIFHSREECFAWGKKMLDQLNKSEYDSHWFRCGQQCAVVQKTGVSSGEGDSGLDYSCKEDSGYVTSNKI